MNRLIVTSSPHLRQKRNTRNVMSDVLIALAPAAIASVVLFGINALIILITCIVSCLAFEFLYLKFMKKQNTAGDLSSAVTGTLLAFCLPSTLPFWMAIIGSFIAIIIVKQLFGGLGKNFANPAIVARIVLMLSYAGPMSRYPSALDAAAGATPLASGKFSSYLDLFIGNVGGSLGEVSALAILIGGIYLVVRKVITPTIPLSFLGSVAVFALLFGQDPLFHVLAGGAMLGAVFMATDYVTSPSTEMGKLIYGVCCGLLTMGMRVYFTLPEGVSYAILLMNILTPIIDNFTMTKPLGGETA